MRALLVLLALGTFTAQAATFYRGTVGVQAVVLKLNGAGGSYFYARRGVDIPLEVQESEGALAVTEVISSFDQLPNGDYGKVTGRMDLTRAAGDLTGTWHSPDGARNLPVRLKPVNVAAERLALPATPGLLKLRAEDALSFLKLNHPFAPAPGRASLNWLREPLSGVVYPRLPGRAPGNAALQDRQLAAAVDALACQSDLGDKDAGQTAWTQTTRVTWLSPRLLSLQDDVEYFCGGAHPDAYTSGLILDRATGRTLTAHDLWPRLSPATLHRRYLAAYPRTADNGDCLAAIQQTEPDWVNTPDAYTTFLSARGLTVWPTYLPHVALACAEEVTLPYASLAPLAGPLAPRR